MSSSDTIVAISTPPGMGAIAVLRLSGPDAITITDKLFKGTRLCEAPTHTAHFGVIYDQDIAIDEVVVTLFKAPRSYTKENIAEISCHGSPYIQQRLLNLILDNGARLANHGEFTMRAFLNGRFDLSQAEAVADLIAAQSEAGHRLAMNQMRGGVTDKIKVFREKLIHFASLIELELDFGEEDVEFASRNDLRASVMDLDKHLFALAETFHLGNAIREGVPVAIVGRPNAGKSTLLNALLQEEKAIVSSIAGTTRDFIEDSLNINGIPFRIIDTAGIRDDADNEIERIGIERSYAKIAEASLVLYMADASGGASSQEGHESETIEAALGQIENLRRQYPDKHFLLVGNKADLNPNVVTPHTDIDMLLISARNQENIDSIRRWMVAKVEAMGYHAGDTLITNARHYRALIDARNSLQRVLEGLDTQVSGDFLAMDIRHALRYIGDITGQIDAEDLLDNIFSKFCIGK